MNALEVAVAAAQLAGARIRADFDRPQHVGWKGRADPVTETDRQAEELIVDTIRQSFPNHRFLCEENHKDDVASEYLWVVDPLDGTQNFSRGIPFVSVSIALAHNGEAILGVLHDPLRNETFCAERGKGAFLNGRPVRVQPPASLGETMVSIGVVSAQRPENPRLTLPMHAALYPNVGWTRSFGSTALELAYVAGGRLDLVYQDRLNPWDILAGALLVQESGGVATDFGGQPVTAQSCGIIAAARPAFHSAALRIAQILDSGESGLLPAAPGCV